jgi:hypothetical protein
MRETPFEIDFFAGKYVTRKTFVPVLREVWDPSQVLVEWMVAFCGQTRRAAGDAANAASLQRSDVAVF